MSDATNMIYGREPSLLTIKGQVSIQFLDGQVMEGEFVTQDQFNIFLTINSEPVMIPRAQIRVIKGKHIEQIVADDSQQKFIQPGLQPTILHPELSQRERFDTEEYVLPLPIQASLEEKEKEEEAPVLEADLAVARPVIEEDDGAGPVDIDQYLVEQVEADTVIKDDEGTVVLDLNQYPSEQAEADEDGTMILPPDVSRFPWTESEDNTDEGTLILGPLQGQPSEEEDMDVTVVVPDISTLDDQEDATVVIEEKKEPEITAKLTCTSGPHTGQVFQLRGGITTLGRSSDNIFVLAQDKEISRHHAIILQESGRFVIQDQNSLNGTFVNDEQISGPRYLKDGDEILVGLSTLKYQAEDLT